MTVSSICTYPFRGIALLSELPCDLDFVRSYGRFSKRLCGFSGLEMRKINVKTEGNYGQVSGLEGQQRVEH